MSGERMIVLFSERKSKLEKEIIEILKKSGANYISDKAILGKSGKFTIISEYKECEIKLKKGIAVFCDDTERFKNQILPKGFVGICQDNNKNALNILKQNGIPVITCGTNHKNTVTISSINKENIFICIQRSINNFKKQEIEPTELKIISKKSYNPFSLTAAATVLLLKGIYPKAL